MDKFWVDSPSSNPGSGYDRNQSYTGLPLDEDEFGFGKKKSARDPMSHRIIEKRRRDRMNNCLADLSRLLPTACMKKGRGRIEKTEIIEMAIRHFRHLQAHSACQQEDKCDIASYLDRLSKHSDQYRKGFNDCMTETVHFMSQLDNLPAPEVTCTRLMTHLQQHCEKNAREVSRAEAASPAESGSAASTNRPENTRSTSSSEGPQSSSTGGDSGDSRRGSGSDDSSPRTADKESISTGTEYEQFCSPDTYSHHQDRRSHEKGHFSRRNHEERPDFTRRDLDGRIDRSQTPSGRTTPPASPNCSSSSEHGSNGSYKFKNNIKQRFAADAGGDHEFRCNSPRERRDSTDGCVTKRPRLYNEDSRKRSANGLWEPKCEPMDRPVLYQPTASKASVKHYDYPINMPSSTDASSASSMGHASEQSIPVWQQRFEPEPSDPESLPIFALHPKGTFYVPLSIELALIAPLLTDTAQCSSLLHQVSIAVNFSVPAKVITLRSAVALRDSAIKRPPSAISQESTVSLPEQPHSVHPHMEMSLQPRWDEQDERDLGRFHMKNRFENGNALRQELNGNDPNLMRRNSRMEAQQAASDPARWSLLMANARRS